MNMTIENTYGKTVELKPIDVGAGWELVPLDEVLQIGDEVYTNFHGWTSHSWYGCTPCFAIVEKHCGLLLAFRRRVAASRWVKISDRAVVYPAWIFYPGGVTYASRQCYLPTGSTHWQPASLPQPPVPEKSAEDLAFEKAFSAVESGNDIKVFRAMFTAGRDFQKGEK